MGDSTDQPRPIISHVGLDIGTKNIVMSLDADPPIILHEINGYFIYPNATKFVENMLSTEKLRADGTTRPARWSRFQDRDGIYVLGSDAEQLAYAHNDTLMRPMAEGGISSDEDSMIVLSSLIRGLLSTAENDVASFDKDVTICYSTTAPAVNSDRTNIDFHKQVVDLVITNYDSKSKIIPHSLKESHAIVLAESSDGTGIGISWGAGTVTVSYVLFGNEIYSFCWVGSGDWIDMEIAKRYGYDPKNPRQKSPETPTTVCRRKESIDLAIPATNKLDIEIHLHYKLLIERVIGGIVRGFITNEENARIDKPIEIYMAGGTCSPNGFVKLMKEVLSELDMPFDVSNVNRSSDTLYTVARGCMIASKMF